MTKAAFNVPDLRNSDVGFTFITFRQRLKSLAALELVSQCYCLVHKLWPLTQDVGLGGLGNGDLKLDPHSSDPGHAASEACSLHQNNHIHFILTIPVQTLRLPFFSLSRCLQQE